ncbi:MAG TPA: hypothetical protein VNN22_04370 [Verrucomicrobiae bacterium]|nr:hypothetical protein [Verrucomicrobiae bacterium]
MKRWAVLTVLLYALALLVLALPVFLIAFGNWGKNETSHGLHEVIQSFYLNWGYWLWLAVMVSGQALLLILPIHIAERRLPARRPLKIPIIVTTFFLANLLLAGLVSLLCAIFRDDGFEIFTFADRMANCFRQPSADQETTWGGIVSISIITIIFWIGWAFIFRRATRADEPDALLKRATRWLLRGSILELIIAVPSHVIVRRRDDCCAPAGTFWGIATGLSVMLLCFGPGVYFLFVERCQKLKPKPVDKNIE